jgi:CRISPR-associated protein Csx17
LDAAVLLTEENPRYPPLLGTGGNDGRLDFTNNYMQRLVELFDAASGKAAPEASKLLNSALFGMSTTGLKSSAIGQFYPGAAGGPNATTGFDAGSLINPWDFVLMLEGAVLFAAAATRRLESAEPGVMSYPFTVRATGSGEGNTALNDEGNARAEIWLPLWNNPTGLEEIKNLLSEGRVTLDRKPVRDGLDFVRAISRLGIERGIDAFQRYAFVMRSGKAYLATPLARVNVSRNTAARLIDQLDSRESNNWLYRFRKLARAKESPARIQSLVRKLEDALFDLAKFDEPKYVQQVLILLGQIQGYLSESSAGREKCSPVPVLTEEWVNKANDNSPEFQIACALASIHAKVVNDKSPIAMFMAEHFAPVQESYKFRKWDEEAHHSVVWSRNTLEDNLYAVLQRRLLDVERNSLPDKPLAGTASAPLSAITAWFNGGADPRRITDLLAGLVLIRLSFSLADDSYDYPLPAAYALLKPFFCTDEQLHKTGLLPKEVCLPLSRELVMRIWRNDSGVLDLAKRRLKAAACPLQGEHIRYEGNNGRALLAALMIPISNKSLQKLTDPLRTKQQPATETIIE